VTNAQTDAENAGQTARRREGSIIATEGKSDAGGRTGEKRC